MTQEDIIRMAREAQSVYSTTTSFFQLSPNQLEHFATLVLDAKPQAREYLAPEPAGERADLIEQLNRYAAGDEFQRAIEQAANMLEADAQQVKQAPMTDDQIIATFCTTPDFRQYVSAFKAGVKLAEKYHGIGGQP